jgi:serine/threonine protein kinase
VNLVLENGEEVVHKRFRSLDSYVRERNLLLAFGHANIIKPIRVDDDSNTIVFEYMPNGDLLKLIMRRKLPVEVVSYVFHEIVKAVEYIHSRGVAHHDLKLANILIGKEFNVQLLDFEHAEQFMTQESNSVSPAKLVKGTAGYMAPEIWEKKPYDGQAADMFALGVILFTLYTGARPFNYARGDDDNYYYLQKDTGSFLKLYLPVRKDTDPLFADLIGKLLEHEPSKRMTMPELKAHLFMQIMQNPLGSLYKAGV